MALQVTPPLPDAERQAVGHALERAGIWLDARPAAYASPWWRTAALEAVDNAPVPARYAPSPRSTRGATRA
jgi:hypothetical protein